MFNPRPYQLEVLHAMRTKNRAICVWHRRAGKDYFGFHLMLERALAEPGQYFYVFPSYTQARKALWDLRDNEGRTLRDLIPEWALRSMNANEMKILLKSGSLIQLVGAENPDSLRGTNPKGLIFSEFAMCEPEVWSAVAKPILAQNNGWALFISTPMGRNHFYDLFEAAKLNSEWVVSVKTIEDTGVVPPEIIAQDREEGMSEDLILQEYYCTPAHSQVMTADGMKAISDIEAGELVLSHSGRFRRVLNTMTRAYEGPLIKIQTYGHTKPLELTPNHAVRVCDPSSQSYSWIEAGHLTTGQFLCFPKLSAGQSFCDEDLAELIGRYVSDGSVGGNQVTLTLGNKKQHILERLRQTWESKGINSCLLQKESDNAWCLFLNSTTLSDFFLTYCTACSKTKKLPITLIGGHHKKLAEWLLEGDGCPTKDGWMFSSTSLTLAHQAMTVFHSAGYRARIHLTKGTEHEAFGRLFKGSDVWRVDVETPTPETEKLIRLSKYCQIAQIKSINTIDYSGNVYNLHVEKDNSYTIWGRAVHNCQWTAGVDGLIYAAQIERARTQGRIGAVSYDPATPVHTAWDLGISDSTAIIAFQLVQTEVHIIHYLEATGKELGWYIERLREWGYTYGKHFAPHDVEARSLQTGLSLKQQAAKLGLAFVTIPMTGLQAGIQQTRATLARCWFDEQRCKTLLKALSKYTKAWDPRRKVWSDAPKHDESSHAADAMRYLAQALPTLRAATGRSGTDIMREAFSSHHVGPMIK